MTAHVAWHRRGSPSALRHTDGAGSDHHWGDADDHDTGRSERLGSGAAPALPAPTDVPAVVSGADKILRDGNEAPPGGPSGGRVRRVLQALRVGRSRASSTPFRLRLGMALPCLPLLAFATAVHLGVERNESTVTTVGTEAYAESPWPRPSSWSWPSWTRSSFTAYSARLH